MTELFDVHKPKTALMALGCVMIENARTGLVWKSFMSNKHIQAGIQRAGFRSEPQAT